MVDSTGSGKAKVEKIDNNAFDWQTLINNIKRGYVIPVVGHGLYRVNVEQAAKYNILLYDYLANCIANRSDADLPGAEPHRFAKACLEFLKSNGNNYLELNDFLKEKLSLVKPVPGDSLWNLARIKGFDIFITTAYDDLLKQTVARVRSTPAEVFAYTVKEKDWLSVSDSHTLYRSKEQPHTMIYHFFGSKDNMVPAYTERDIIETVLEFHADLAQCTDNRFAQKLRNCRLLFLGCRYDDWLLRFFMRTVANEPFPFLGRPEVRNFLGDDLENNIKDPFAEMPRFMKHHNIQLFHAPDSDEFIRKLFEEIGKEWPGGIVPPADFPVSKVFISFHGKDREIARVLADNLERDGINVWLDERRFAGGDHIDQTIIKAIDECRVFIPLISHNSRQIEKEEGKAGYHIKEWEWAYKNMKKGLIRIIPIKIDGVDWCYEGFERLLFYQVPNGTQNGDYSKLVKQLKEIQENK